MYTFDKLYNSLIFEFSEPAILKIIKKFESEAPPEEIRNELKDFEKYKNNIQLKDPFQYKSWEDLKTGNPDTDSDPPIINKHDNDNPHIIERLNKYDIGWKKSVKKYKDGGGGDFGNFQIYDGVYKLPKSFKNLKITGDFDIIGLHLSTLENCPKVVEGDFNCGENNISSLIGSPEWVGGDFDCSDNFLKSFEGVSKYIGGDLIYDSSYISLEYLPETIVGDIIINGEKLQLTKEKKNLKPFKEFFLEYRHNLADGSSKPSIQVNNGKNPNRIGPDKKYLYTKGDRKHDNPKMDIPGSILTLPELEEMGIKDFESGKILYNFKNSNTDIQMFTNNKGQWVGRVIKH